MILQRIHLLLLAFLIIDGCQLKKSGIEQTESAIPVVTAEASKISYTDSISLSGNIEGYRTVRLGFLVAGKVDFISHNEGEKLSKGELIASLDPANYLIAKELADIQVNQVQDEYDRLKMMYENKSLSESDFSKISHGLQQAKAQQKLHTKNLSETKLYSPITGILLKKLCEVGEITGVGIPLFVVSDIRRVKVSAFIPENELHSIHLGQDADVMVTSLDRTYNGKVTEVGSAADPASRAFSVKIDVENPELLIRPGMIAEIKIPTGYEKELIAVPAEAVLHDFNDISYIYLIDTSKKKAFRNNIIPGMIMNDQIEVVSGVSPGEIIVKGGQQKLVDGSSVIITK